MNKNKWSATSDKMLRQLPDTSYEAGRPSAPTNTKNRTSYWTTGWLQPPNSFLMFRQELQMPSQKQRKATDIFESNPTFGDHKLI